jgi:heat shock protein HslJ
MRPIRLAGPLLLLLLTCAAACVTACGKAGPGGAGEAPREPLQGRTFLSSQTTPHALVAGTRVSLAFTGDGRLVATAGCNTMSGQVEVRDGTLAVDGLATTEMGCDPPRHEQDDWLAKTLGAGPRWRLDGATLTLTSGDTTLVLTDREVADPDRPLADGTWAVDTLVDGQTAASTPATATLEFRDGKVDIFGGCNEGSADYTPTGDTIRFGLAAMTRKACEPDIMRLEAAVLAVVRDTATVEIDADRMTLTQPSGKGLQLHAQ